LLLQNGESPANVQKQAGHNSMDMTINVYGYFIPGGNPSAVDGLDDILPEKVANRRKTLTVHKLKPGIQQPAFRGFGRPPQTRRWHRSQENQSVDH
jgi:hypothetical protein